jgi:hypothetical protein
MVQPRLVGRPHRNRQLFSDHYLDTILPNRPDWRMARDDAAEVMAAVRRIKDA